MIENIKNWILHAIWQPIIKNLAFSMFVIGVIYILIGTFTSTESIKEFFSNTGGAILGGGVFAIIMKSAQFTQLFQKHIFEVFFDPASIQNDQILPIQKWRIITRSILKSVLPASYITASDLIEKQFFNSELEYHFENYEVAYTLTIINDMVIIRVKTKTKIVLSPNLKKEPILSQSIEAKNDFKVCRLRLGDEKDLTAQEINSIFKKSDTSNYIYELKAPLKKYLKPNSNTISFERVVEWKQNINREPHIKGVIHRYIKGAIIRVKVVDDEKRFQAHYERFGLGMSTDERYVEDDGTGFKEWTLAQDESLLLPGQGYILLILPTEN